MKQLPGRETVSGSHLLSNNERTVYLLLENKGITYSKVDSMGNTWTENLGSIFFLYKGSSRHSRKTFIAKKKNLWTSFSASKYKHLFFFFPPWAVWNTLRLFFSFCKGGNTWKVLISHVLQIHIKCTGFPQTQFHFIKSQLSHNLQDHMKLHHLEASWHYCWELCTKSTPQPKGRE